MSIVSSPDARCNSDVIFMGSKPLLAKGLDETSTPKRLAGAFSRTRCQQLRFSKHGWIYRDEEDAPWRPDAAAALRAAREFCYAASEQLRAPMLTAPALIAEMLRLAQYEPLMRRPVRDDEVELATRGRA